MNKPFTSLRSCAVIIGVLTVSGTFAGADDALKILPNGNVGVGVDAPAAVLELKPPAAGQAGFYAPNHNYGGSRFPNPNGSLLFQSDATGASGGTIYFMSVDSSGGTHHVKIHTSTNRELLVLGDAEIEGTLYETSSAHWKKDVQPLTSGISKIKQLRPVSFRWDEEALKTIGKQAANDRVHLGLIAEEVAMVVPEAVSTSKDSDDPNAEEHSAIAYSHLVPLLIQAVKEQQTQIEALQAQVDALKGGETNTP